MSCKRFGPAIAAHAGGRGARAGRGASPRRVRGVPAAARHPGAASGGARRRARTEPVDHRVAGFRRQGRTGRARRRRGAGAALDSRAGVGGPRHWRPQSCWRSGSALTSGSTGSPSRADGTLSGSRTRRQASADAGSRPDERSERSTEAGGCTGGFREVRLHAGRTASRNARLKPERCRRTRLSHPVVWLPASPETATRACESRGTRLPSSVPARHRRAVPGAGDSAAARADDPGPPRRKDAAASSDPGGGTRRTDHCATRNCRNQGPRRRDRQPPASRAAAAVNKEPCP